MTAVTVDTVTVVRMIAAMTAVHATVTTMEHLLTLDRFESGEIFGWDVCRLFVSSGGSLSAVARPFLRPPRFRALLGLRLVTAIALLGLAITGRVHALVVAVLFLTNLAIGYRHPGGLSGTFQLQVVVTAGLLVATAAPVGSPLELLGILFIAAQSVLSYLVAGVSKLGSGQWRDGSALCGIFATKTWGSAWVYDLVTNHPRIRVTAAYGVILFECLFAAALFVDTTWALAIFGAGILFHAATAAFMGLNDFLLMFPATYPAVLYANQYLHQTFI